MNNRIKQDKDKLDLLGFKKPDRSEIGKNMKDNL